jgi:alanine racemase
MTLTSKVIAIRSIPKGESVGYGATWVAAEPRRIASIGIGYGDGYPRHAIEGTPVLVAGQEAKLVGRVSMDSITVDVSDCKNIQVGDDVTLWGKGLPIEWVAEKSATISYDLLCGVAARVPRIYQD